MKIGDNTPPVNTDFRIRQAATIRIDGLNLTSHIPVQTGSSGQFSNNNVGLQAEVDIKQGDRRR